MILAPLGEGGMGVVLEAFDPELDRRVAIKLLRPSNHEGSNRQMRLLREAQALARLSHPNVVQVHDAGVAGGRVFLAMELVRGATARQWLKTRPTPAEIVNRFIEAGRGLAAAHAVGIVHRDFKPDNIIISDDGPVRVLDFGLANYDAAADKAPSPTPNSGYLKSVLTQTGIVLGTPAYMAPEQHSGEKTGPAADQFSFCVALHEALFGERPFQGRSELELATSVLEGRIVEPKRPGRVPRWLNEIIRRGLSIDPADRFESIDALLAALGRDPVRARRRWLAMGGATVAVAAFAWVAATRVASEQCKGAEAQMASVWGDADRDLLEASPKVVETLDRYTTDWAAAHMRTCSAHVDGALSSELLDASMACLQRRNVAIDSLVSSLDEAAPATSAQAVAAAAALPSIAACEDRQALAQRITPPLEKVGAVGELRDRLSRAEVLHNLGSVDAAVNELDAIASEAETIAFGPLSAEVALIAGRLAMDRFHWDTAHSALSEAMVTGLAAKADAIAAEALARRIFVEGMTSTEFTGVLEDREVAVALLQRVGEPAALTALLANNVGVIHGVRGDREAAQEEFARAVSLAADAEDVSRVDRAGYAMNLASHTADGDERDALFVRAHDEMSAALGSHHPRALEVAARRAETTRDPAASLALLRPGCPMHEDVAQRHRCHWRVAEALEQLGRSDEARKAAASALATFAGAPREGQANAQRLKTEAYLAILEGRHEQALASLAGAQQEFKPQAHLPWIAFDLADVALLRARSLQALGRINEARAPLEVAIKTYEERAAHSQDQAPRYRRAQAQRLLDELGDDSED